MQPSLLVSKITVDVDKKRKKNMSFAVQKPNLNQGVEAGIFGPRFENDRGMDMGFSRRMLKWQTTTAKQTNPRITYQIPILPPDNDWVTRWSEGTFIFLQRNDALLKNAFSLETLRFLMHQTAITRFANEKRRKTAASPLEAEALKNMGRGRGRNYNFLSTIEEIQDNIEFAGVLIGPAEPTTATGTSEANDISMYSGNFMNLPLIIHGHGWVPNPWGELQTMQDLYMIIKPMPILDTYYAPTGEPHNIPEEMRKKRELICDIQFTSYRPAESAGLKELYECKGEQPPIDTASWIDWTYNERGEVIDGQLRRGIVYHVGKANHSERAVNSGGYVPSSKKAERLQWTSNMNTIFKKMEILLTVSRERGYC